MANSGTVTRGRHSAEFEVVGKMLKVTSPFGVKHAQLGRTPPEVLAGMLLREQIDDANRDK